MPSTTPLTDAISALTTYANTVTGASDTDLSSAVATLASGYGTGGNGDIDLSNQALWEIGAVGGQLNGTYPDRKQTGNTARLRGVYLFETYGFSYTFTMNWGGEWQAQYAQYGSDGLSKVAFEVMTQDTVIPTTYPFIAIVLRHVDGTTNMAVSDVDIMKPKLVLNQNP